MKICGVYKILNKVNGKCYIGSSSDVNKRISTHKRRLLTGKHESPVLQRVYNKYGLSSLEFILLEECSLDQQIALEQKYIDTIKPQYNIALDALAPMAGRKHSEITKLKMSRVPHPKGKDSWSYGKKWSPEFREKVLASRRGFKHSAETRKKMRNTALLKKSHLRMVGANKRAIRDSFNNTFISLVEAAKHWQISVQAVCDNLKGRSKLAKKQVYFRYIESF